MKTALDLAQDLIDACENAGPYSILTLEDAEPLIVELGGKPSVISCQHSATICIYIAALMVRRQEQK